MWTAASGQTDVDSEPPISGLIGRISLDRRISVEFHDYLVVKLSPNEPAGSSDDHPLYPDY